MKHIIKTADAPAAIGPYSQAVRIGNTVYLSGQIPLDPVTNEVCDGGFSDRANQVFKNISTVATAAGGGLASIVKLTIYVTDMGVFSILNEVMEKCWPQPYPARAVVEVSALPRGVDIEMDAIMVIEGV